MSTEARHFKFINSKTGNVIHHQTIKGDKSEADIKTELEKVKAEVATRNAVFLNTIYWEEEKDQQ
ncbi:MAG TPA: hypothetical protein VL490_07570 [Mucilaginibacter sp.]|nr:hypothetical protein [Mucilaginibacter sp.]